MSLIQRLLGECNSFSRSRSTDPDYIAYRMGEGQVSTGLPFDKWGWQYVLDMMSEGYVPVRVGKLIILNYMPDSVYFWRGEA